MLLGAFNDVLSKFNDDPCDHYRVMLCANYTVAATSKNTAIFAIKCE